jgi:Thaumatin family
MSCDGSNQCAPNYANLYSANGINSKSCFVSNPAPAGLDQYCGGYALWNINGKPLPSSIATPSVPANKQWVSIAKPPEKIFKYSCPSAYSYQFDDAFSTFQCEGQSDAKQPGYVVTFCPAGAPGAAP